MFEIDYLTKIKEIEQWIANTIANAGFQHVVVAVSGGVDSAVSLHMAVKALGPDHVYALLLPHGELSQKSLDDGKLVVTSVGLVQDHVFIRDIEPATVELLRQVQRDTSFDIRRGNIMARVRMIYLYDMAKELHALALGTENKSEHYLGYFTRFGDEASDLEPIRAFCKTQVWEMAKYLGVPAEIIAKQPTAGLWAGQHDEGEFGFSYVDADKILYHRFEEKKARDEIIALGFPDKLVDSVLEFVAKNEFKHNVPFVFEG